MFQLHLRLQLGRSLLSTSPALTRAFLGIETLEKSKLPGWLNRLSKKARPSQPEIPTVTWFAKGRHHFMRDVPPGHDTKDPSLIFERDPAS